MTVVWCVLPLGSSGGTSYGMVAILRSSAPAEEERTKRMVEVFNPKRPPKSQVHDRAGLLELGQGLGVQEGEDVLREERLVGAATELAREGDLSPRGGEAAGLERSERKKEGRVLARGGIGRRGIRLRRRFGEDAEMPVFDEFRQALGAVVAARPAQPDVFPLVGRIRMDDPRPGTAAVGAGEGWDPPAPPVGGDVGPRVGRIDAGVLGGVRCLRFGLLELGTPAFGRGPCASAAAFPRGVRAPRVGSGAAPPARTLDFPHQLTW
jgi:hypothetical protein